MELEQQYLAFDFTGQSSLLGGLTSTHFMFVGSRVRSRSESYFPEPNWIVHARSPR